MEETPNYERELRIDARPETVFSFFTQPEKLQQWKGSSPDLDPKPGGIFSVRVANRQQMVGEYLEIKEFSRIVFSWGWADESMAVPPGSS